MKSIKGLAHIAILTDDIEKSIKFYERLGGQCTARGSVQKPTGVNQLAMLTIWDMDLEFIQPGDGSGKGDLGSGRIPHIAIEVEDLPHAVNMLKCMGISTFQTEKPNVLPDLFGGLQNIFFTGPSGELIELIEHFSE